MAFINLHPVLVDIVGTERLTNALGLHGLFIALGQLVAGPVSGKIINTCYFSESMHQLYTLYLNLLTEFSLNLVRIQFIYLSIFIKC